VTHIDVPFGVLCRDARNSKHSETAMAAPAWRISSELPIRLLRLVAPPRVDATKWGAESARPRLLLSLFGATVRRRSRFDDSLKAIFNADVGRRSRVSRAASTCLPTPFRLDLPSNSYL
jgi:hypothetical protein